MFKVPNDNKGRVRLTDPMNFRKSSKRLLTPPLIFGKLHCAFRDKIVTKVRMLIWRHCCVLYDPISHEMHVVQMFNMVIGLQHTLKRVGRTSCQSRDEREEGAGGEPYAGPQHKKERLWPAELDCPYLYILSSLSIFVIYSLLFVRA